MTDIWIQDAITYWEIEKTELSLGTNLNSIISLEKYIGIKLPIDFVEFYQNVNGFKNLGVNSNLFRIWSIEKIKDDYTISKNKEFISFGDYMMASHQIGFTKNIDGVFNDYDLGPPLQIRLKSLYISLIVRLQIRGLLYRTKYKMKIYIFIILCCLGNIFNTSAQNFDGRLVLGEKVARQEIKEALKGHARPFYDTLITEKATAIAIAEALVFKIYGKEDIESERPYEIYRIDGYWYISGTLPKDYQGGTFIIIINSINGEVIRLIHGK